jgi:hypothetical protein
LALAAALVFQGLSARGEPLPQPPPRPPEFGTRPEQPLSLKGETQPAERLEAKPERPPEAAQTGQTGCIGALMAMPGNRIRPAAQDQLPRDPACRIDEPVLVKGLAVRSKAATVTLTPPPTLSCAMAKAVGEWLDVAVQPLTRGYFERDLVALQVGGGQECRRRNRAATGRLSEHATGAALDIFALRVEPAGNAPSDIRITKPDGVLQERFLAAIRQSACGAFATALGPGADAAHADHLHVDIQDRRSRASRFCQ